MAVAAAAVAGALLAPGISAPSALAQGAPAVRPAPFTLAHPAAPAGDSCSEAKRAAFVAGFDAELDTVMSYGQAIGEYSEAFANWKGARLIEQGVWTDEDQGAFALALLEDERFMGYYDALNAEMATLRQAGVVYARAVEGGDPADVCAGALETLQTAHRIVDNADAQWRYMLERYDDVARARGATLY